MDGGFNPAGHPESPEQFGEDFENRRNRRAPVRLRARLRDRSSTKFDIPVMDLSLTGFRAEASYSLNPGDIVWVSLPGLAGLEATIAWREGRFVGAAFRQPLHPAVFDHISSLDTTRL